MLRSWQDSLAQTTEPFLERELAKDVGSIDKVIHLERGTQSQMMRCEAWPR